MHSVHIHTRVELVATLLSLSDSTPAYCCSTTKVETTTSRIPERTCCVLSNSSPLSELFLLLIFAD